MKAVAVISGDKVSFTSSTYQATGGIYIGSVIAEGEDKGMPYGDFTICLPDVPLRENEVIVPKYKLYGEAYIRFKEALVDEELYDVKHGFAESRVVRLKSNWKELTTELV